MFNEANLLARADIQFYLDGYWICVILYTGIPGIFGGILGAIHKRLVTSPGTPAKAPVDGSEPATPNNENGESNNQASESVINETGESLAWEAEILIGGMGGLKSTLFSGEGLVMKFSGRGKIYLQTRTLGGMAGWLSPYCRG